MPIFHAELLDTDIYLFTEHYDYAIARNLSALIGEYPRESKIITNRQTPPDYRENYVIHINKMALWLGSDPYLPIRNNRTYQDEIILPHFARGAGYQVYAGGTTEKGWQDNRHLFSLSVLRYRWHSVRLVLEEEGSAGVYSAFLKNWLAPRWGKSGKEGEKGIGYIVLDPKLAALQSDDGVDSQDADASYESRIRAAAARYSWDNQAKWKAVIQLYAEWRKAEPGTALHKRLAEIMICSEAHIKKMWGQYKPYDDSA